MKSHKEVYKKYLVHLIDSHKEVVGTALLIDKDIVCVLHNLVLLCIGSTTTDRHIEADKVASKVIYVKFPFHNNNTIHKANIILSTWDSNNLLTLLRLKEKPILSFLKIRNFSNSVPIDFDSDLNTHTISFYGYQLGNKNGKWESNIVKTNNREQIFMLKKNGLMGFWGSPVWDEDLGNFVGIIDVINERDENELYMIPFKTIRSFFIDHGFNFIANKTSKVRDINAKSNDLPIELNLDEEIQNTRKRENTFTEHSIRLNRFSQIPVNEQESCLNADEYAEALAKVLNGARGEVCFAVFGDWGRGKTFLMQKVARILSKGDYECVEFSAWKYRIKPEVWIYLYETLRKKALKIYKYSELEINENPFSKIIISLLRRLKIYLAKNGIWKGVFIPYIIAIPFLLGVPLGWSGLLLGLTFLLFGVLLPLKLILLIFGISFNVSKYTGLSKKSFRVPEYSERLGLQETVSEDLRNLLFGWVGFSKKNQEFMAKYIKFWNLKTLTIYFILGLFLAILFGRNIRASEVLWQNYLQPIWAFISKGDFFTEVVTNILNTPIIDTWLNEIINTLSKFISINASPIMINFLVWSTLIIFPLLPLPFIFFDRNKSKILLIVDDLDRLESDDILNIIESLKLLLEDNHFRDLIQIAIICERRSLEKAFREKYRGLFIDEDDNSGDLKSVYSNLSLEQLIEENIQKLFVSHICLPPLSEDEQNTILKYLLGYKKGTEKVLPSFKDRVGTKQISNKKPSINDNRNKELILNSKSKYNPLSISKKIFDKFYVMQYELYGLLGNRKKETVSSETLSDQEKEALINALSELSDWVRLSPRALQSYIFRYQLARELLRARNEDIDSSKLAQSISRKLSGKDLDYDISKNMEAVLNEVI